MRRGLFYPELTLGADTLSHSRRIEIQDFLIELARVRSFPLHVANLWNALYFGYNLDAPGYSIQTIEPKRIPVREMATRDWALPIGSFARVRTRTTSGDLLAEVVYKEGAHAAVSADFVDPAISGAPPTEYDDRNGMRVGVLQERFVLDLSAFGSEANSISPSQYERLLRRARWLDEHGHLIIEAMYLSDEAQLEDLDYYAEYLLKEHREGLLAFAFREEPSEVELREALVRSLEAVADLAMSCQEFRSWRGKYFFTKDQYQQQAMNRRSDAILGSADLHYVFSGITRIPAEHRVSYSAIGPRILDFLSRNGSHATEEAMLIRGPSFATSVVYLNTYILDRLQVEAPTGVSAGVHLRLDDDWQAGGIWRAERSDLPTSLTLVPPEIPLHLAGC